MFDSAEELFRGRRLGEDSSLELKDVSFRGSSVSGPGRACLRVRCPSERLLEARTVSRPYLSTYSRNVKRWRNGTMVVRWVSAAIVEAEKTFRRVHGWRDITKLVSALAVLEAKEEAATEQVA